MPTTSASTTLSPVSQQRLLFAAYLMALGLIFWLPTLSFFNLNIDQEHALYRTDQRIWLSQGRWGIYMLYQYLYPQAVLSYLPHLLYLLGSSLAYMLLLDALALDPSQPRQRAIALLAYPVFMAHPIWYFAAEFYTNLVPNTLGMIAVCAAGWLYAKGRFATWQNIALQIALLIIAVSLYQSLVFMLVAVYCLLSLQLQHSYKKILTALLILLIGLLLQHAIWLGLLAYYQVSPKVLDPAASLAQPLATLINTLTHALHLYAGYRFNYGASFFASGLVAAVGVYALLRQDLKQLPKRLLVVAVLLISPFSLDFLTGPHGSTPYRSLLAVPMVMWFLSFSALLFFAQGFSKRRFYVLVVLVLLLNLQLLHLGSRYNTMQQFRTAHDELTAQLLYQRIQALIPDFNRTQSYTLDVQQGLPFSTPYAHVPTTTLDGSFFWWDNGSPSRIVDYMRLQGFVGLTASTPEQHQQYEPIYEHMPAWPNPDSVQRHGEAILVKFR